MKVIDCYIDGLKVVELDLYGDRRGFFVERYNEKKFRDLGLPINFVQDNHSRSAPGVLRGLHYQVSPEQGKLVGVVRGKIWDVAVDIRPDSPTFGEYFGVELSGVNGKLFWMPPGFAHGFYVLDDEPADVVYKITSLYKPDTENGIAWNDPKLNVKWPLDGSEPTVSDRDNKLMSFEEYRKNPPNWG